MTYVPSGKDYSAMSAPKMIEACADDALAWAEAFCQHVRKNEIPIDEDIMIGWFANAIEAAWAKRSARAMMDKQPGVIDDG